MINECPTESLPHLDRGWMEWKLEGNSCIRWHSSISRPRTASSFRFQRTDCDDEIHSKTSRRVAMRMIIIIFIRNVFQVAGVRCRRDYRMTSGYRSTDGLRVGDCVRVRDVRVWKTNYKFIFSRTCGCVFSPSHLVVEWNLFLVSIRIYKRIVAFRVSYQNDDLI